MTEREKRLYDALLRLGAVCDELGVERPRLSFQDAPSYCEFAAPVRCMTLGFETPPMLLGFAVTLDRTSDRPSQRFVAEEIGRG